MKKQTSEKKLLLLILLEFVVGFLVLYLYLNYINNKLANTIQFINCLCILHLAIFIIVKQSTIIFKHKDFIKLTIYISLIIISFNLSIDVSTAYCILLPILNYYQKDMKFKSIWSDLTIIFLLILVLSYADIGSVYCEYLKNCNLLNINENPMIFTCINLFIIKSKPLIIFIFNNIGSIASTLCVINYVICAIKDKNNQRKLYIIVSIIFIIYFITNRNILLNYDGKNTILNLGSFAFIKSMVDFILLEANNKNITSKILFCLIIPYMFIPNNNSLLISCISNILLAIYINIQNNKTFYKKNIAEIKKSLYTNIRKAIVYLSFIFWIITYNLGFKKKTA